MPIDPMKRDAYLRSAPEPVLQALHDLDVLAKRHSSPRLMGVHRDLADYIAELRHDIDQMLQHRTIGGWPPPPVTPQWQNKSVGPPPTAREVELPKEES